MYHSPNIVIVIKSRRLGLAGQVARMEEGRSAFKVLTCKHTGKRPLGRPSCRWEDNSRKFFKEIGINTRNWIDSAQDKDYWRALILSRYFNMDGLCASPKCYRFSVRFPVQIYKCIFKYK